MDLLITGNPRSNLQRPLNRFLVGRLRFPSGRAMQQLALFFPTNSWILQSLAYCQQILGNGCPPHLNNWEPCIQKELEAVKPRW
jgi:hypothetical protein